MKRTEIYVEDLRRSLAELPLLPIQEVVSILHAARQQGRQIFIMGNGGSASTATHFVCDLAKNTRADGWPHFKVMGLSDNMAIFSAYANDEGYDHVFESQLANWIQPGDIVIGISTSGNSKNVLRAIRLANDAGATTIGFTGFDGGALKAMTDVSIHIANDCIEQVEDIHLMVEHVITKTIRDEIQEATEKPLRVSSDVSGKAEIATADDQETEASALGLQLAEDKKGYTESSLKMLKSISQQLSGELDLSNLLKRTLELTVAGLGAQSGSIMVLDEAGEVVEGTFAYGGEYRTGVLSNLNEMIKGGLAGWVAEHRRAALVADTREDPRWLTRPWDDVDKTRSAVSVPLLAGSRVVGVLTLVNPRERQFTEVDLAYLTAITVCVAFSGSSVLLQPDAITR